MQYIQLDAEDLQRNRCFMGKAMKFSIFVVALDHLLDF